MPVIIGMDPHKRSATIEIIDPDAKILATGRYGTGTTGYGEMLTAAQRFPQRVWAIEGCNGVGRPPWRRCGHSNGACPTSSTSGCSPTSGSFGQATTRTYRHPVRRRTPNRLLT